MRQLKLAATVLHLNTKAPLTIIMAGPLGMLATATTRFATTQVVKLCVEINTITKLDMFATAQLVEEHGATLMYELTPFAQDMSVNREYLKWFGR